VVLVFDAGGVLVELGPPPLKAEWLSDGRSPLVVWQDWLHLDAGRRFESGQTTAEAFAEEMIASLSLDTTVQPFLRHIEAWPVGLFPGTLAWIRGLPKTCETALLSNTNELHWRRMKDEMGLGSVFDHTFLSHQLQLVKPDAAIFDAVIAALGVRPDEVVFFDDNLTNVQAAKAQGMHAHHVVGPQQLRQAVSALLSPFGGSAAS